MSHDSQSETLTIWCNAGLPDTARIRLEAGAAKYRIVMATDGKTGLAGASIAFGQPDPETVLSTQGLRWVQLTSAGYTRYDRDDLRSALPARGSILTNSSHVYDEPCAQHALAMILALARELPQALELQANGERWETAPRRQGSFLLGSDQTVVLLGFGAIGRRLAELLAPFGVKVIAIRRNVAQETGIDIRPESDLPDVLAQADHVMNILPESPSTLGFMSAERLAMMKPDARFYNIGRGATVDQPALIDALNSGRIAAAYLDVTEPEPLPSGHPLWSARNCFITPHSAGGHWNESERLVEHFLANLARFENGEPLADKVY